jgi:hypothetical protein
MGKGPRKGKGKDEEASVYKDTVNLPKTSFGASRALRRCLLSLPPPAPAHARCPAAGAADAARRARPTGAVHAAARRCGGVRAWRVRHACAPPHAARVALTSPRACVLRVRTARPARQLEGARAGAAEVVGGEPRLRAVRRAAGAQHACALLAQRRAHEPYLCVRHAPRAASAPRRAATPPPLPPHAPPRVPRTRAAPHRARPPTPPAHTP